jgi:YVTN family beta-propeller protein
MKHLVQTTLMASALLAIVPTHTVQSAPLQIETKIPLGDIRGRIDHLAIDLNHKRLYVSELGNNTVGVVDVKGGKVVSTLTGLREPQGIGYAPSSDTVYVANAGDGSVHLYRSADLTPLGQIALGDDADNVRVDDAAHRVFVGYGSGAIAVIDTESRMKVADVPLKAHPEGFQLQRGTQHIYVNVPDAHGIALIDRSVNRQVAFWPTRELSANFPMALDESQDRLLTVYRHPARLGWWSKSDASLVSSVESCSDSDDVFVDTKRSRAYVSCGEGFLDIFQGRGTGYVRIAHLATVVGARTSLFVPELDRLYLAVRASGNMPASIWVFRPAQ